MICFLTYCYTLRMKRICTLCFVERDGKILLGKKKRGFGTGRWNGFGGKVEAGEELFASLAREAREELCFELDENNIKKVGELYFTVLDHNDWNDIDVHVYYGACDSDPVETEELVPEWFDRDALPYDEMWVDDKYWLPLLLAGKKFVGRFTLTESNVLSKWSVEEVSSIS